MFELFHKYYKDVNHCIYHLIILTGIITGLLRYKKLTRSSRLFLLLLVITPIAELIAYYCAVKYKDNRFIYAPFNLLQFLIICSAFYHECRSKSIPVIFIVYLAFASINFSLHQPLLDDYVSSNLLLEQLLIIVLFFLYLVYYFRRIDEWPLGSYPLFWLSFGWLIFSICSIVAFGFGNLAGEDSYWLDISVRVKQISNYLLYLSFSIAFLLPQKSLNDVTPGK